MPFELLFLSCMLVTYVVFYRLTIYIWSYEEMNLFSRDLFRAKTCPKASTHIEGHFAVVFNQNKHFMLVMPSLVHDCYSNLALNNF